MCFVFYISERSVLSNGKIFLKLFHFNVIFVEKGYTCTTFEEANPLVWLWLGTQGKLAKLLIHETPDSTKWLHHCKTELQQNMSLWISSWLFQADRVWKNCPKSSSSLFVECSQWTTGSSLWLLMKKNWKSKIRHRHVGKTEHIERPFNPIALISISLF